MYSFLVVNLVFKKVVLGGGGCEACTHVLCKEVYHDEDRRPHSIEALKVE